MDEMEQEFLPARALNGVLLISDTQVANFQLFGSSLILTGYRLFLNPYRPAPEVPLQVR